MYRIIIVLWIISGVVPALGQVQQSDPELRVKILEDSAKIGYPFPVAVVGTYSPAEELYLPDSASTFGSFVYHNREWYRTLTTDSLLKDSVVYYLKTFQTDSSQALQIQADLRVNNDTIPLSSNTDTIQLVHVVLSVPDSMNNILLRQNTQWYRLEKPTNYPYIIAFSSIGLLVLLLFWLLFGKRISTYVKLRSLSKSHSSFLEEYHKLSANMDSREAKEQLLSYWKEYIETVHYIPYRKLTTLELERVVENRDLIENLRKMDAAIYSSKVQLDVSEPLKVLEEFSQEMYQKKLEEIKDGI